MDDNKKRRPMPERPPEMRVHGFDEVTLGYSAEDAVSEASRCLHCAAHPCVDGCPVGVRIPDFLAAVQRGETEAAYRIITSENLFPAICGRVCPQERQCESRCVRGRLGDPVSIGALERYVADAHQGSPAPKMREASEKVAVVGSGPSGLACAGALAEKGYDVTVFEAFHKLGGVLVYGIPEFRLPKRIVQAEIDALSARGVHFQKNAIIGQSISLSELFSDGYRAVFLGYGAGLPQFMNIPGENLLGVYSANEYLTRINLMGAYRENAETPVKRARRIAVIGGGNVAMDAARCAVRMGAEDVFILYRRGKEELPARREEVCHAETEGVRFCLLRNPTRLLGDAEGRVCAVECAEMALSEPDASGRRRPVPVPGAFSTYEADAVIVAIGTVPNPLLSLATPELAVDEKGRVRTDESGMTSLPGVFAGGDAVTGAATVILAMEAGKKAADAMERYLKETK